MQRLPKLDLGLAIAEYNSRVNRLVDEIMEADSTVPLMNALQMADQRLEGEPGSTSWRRDQRKRRDASRVRSIVAEIK